MIEHEFNRKQQILWHYIFDVLEKRSSIHAGLRAMTRWSLLKKSLKMPFHYPRLFLSGQLMEHLPKVLPQYAVNLFLPSLRDENNVVLAIPFCVI
jgi:hypothetical protein